MGPVLVDAHRLQVRRFVLFIAWLTLLPAIGPFPQTSQRFAIVETTFLDFKDEQMSPDRVASGQPGHHTMAPAGMQ